MCTEQDAPQPFACEKTRRGALDFQLFEALAALALEFVLGKRSVARDVREQLENAGRKFGEARRGNRAGISSGAGAEAGAHAAQIFFDAAAWARRGSRANDGRRHFSEAGRAMRHDGVAAPEIKLRGDFRKRARLDQDDLQAVRQRANRALGPGDRTFGAEGRRLRAKNRGGGGCGHRAPPGTTGRRTRTARLRGTRYFRAKACTCSGVTPRNPSRIVFTRSGSPSKSVKQAR